MPSNAREELIELLAMSLYDENRPLAELHPNVRAVRLEDATQQLDALLARRELLLEALGGMLMYPNASRTLWHVPVVSGEQEENR